MEEPSVREGEVVTFRVTVTDCGLLPAPAAAIVILPLYRPAANPEVLAETVRVAGVVPPLVLMDNHVGVPLFDAEAVNVNAPPVELTLNVCEAGDAPPAVALKDMVVVDSERLLCVPITIVRAWEVIFPPLSVSPTVNGKFPICDGVPLMAPLMRFKLKPGGRLPEFNDQTYGATPPVAASV